MCVLRTDFCSSKRKIEQLTAKCLPAVFSQNLVLLDDASYPTAIDTKSLSEQRRNSNLGGYLERLHNPYQNKRPLLVS